MQINILTAHPQVASLLHTHTCAVPRYISILNDAVYWGQYVGGQYEKKREGVGGYPTEDTSARA